MRLWLVFLLVAAASAAPAQSIRLSTSPFASLYGFLRAQLEPGAPLPPGGLGNGVNELAKLAATFPDEIKLRNGTVVRAANGKRDHIDALYWRTIDAYVFGASSITEITELRKKLPDAIGGFLNTRNTLDLIASALQQSRTAYDTRVWPGEQPKLSAQLRYWRENADVRAGEAIRWMSGLLGISATPAPIDVVVVPEAAGKEGMTIRTPSGTRVIVGAGKYKDDDFAEVVLHESLHVLDSASPDQGMLAELRTALDASKRPEIEREQIPHTVMFLLGAEAARRYVRTDHKDVGVTFEIYSKGLERYRQAIEPILKRLIEGKVDRPTAVQEIVRATGA